MGGLELVIYLVIGFLIGGAGGALIFWGLFGDRLQGGHKEERCPNCWYALPGQASLDGAKCSECGWSGPGRRVRSSRRRWKCVLGACVMMLAGAGVAIWPQLRNGGWFNLLPASVQLRIWPRAGYGWYLQNYARSGTAYRKDGPEVAAARRALEPGSGAYVEHALEVMNLAGYSDEESIAAAKRLAVSTTVGWTANKAAVDHLVQGIADDEARVMALMDTLKGMPPRADPRYALEALTQMSNSPRVRTALVQYAFRSAGAHAGEAQSELGRFAKYPAAEAMKLLEDMSDDAELDSILSNQSNNLVYRLNQWSDEFAYWLFRNMPRLKSSTVEQLTSYVQNIKDMTPLADEIDRVLADPRDVRYRTAQAIAGQRDLVLPKFIQRNFEKVVSPGSTMDARVWREAMRCSPEDRPKLIAMLDHENINIRRMTCRMLVGLPEAETSVAPKLMQVQADASQSEEVRVAARDALRSMKLWPPRVKPDPTPDPAPVP